MHIIQRWLLLTCLVDSVALHWLNTTSTSNLHFIHPLFKHWDPHKEFTLNLFADGHLGAESQKGEPTATQADTERKWLLRLF